MNLFELTKLGLTGTISPSDLVDALEEIADAGRGFGYADAKDVVKLLNLCSPALTQKQLTRIRNSCRNGATKLSGSGRAFSVKDFEVVGSAAEAKLASA